MTRIEGVMRAILGFLHYAPKRYSSPPRRLANRENYCQFPDASPKVPGVNRQGTALAQHPRSRRWFWRHEAELYLLGA